MVETSRKLYTVGTRFPRFHLSDAINSLDLNELVILKNVKTAVSIPDDLLEKAEALAASLGKNRSELVTDALREYIIRHGDADSADLEAYAREIALSNPW